LYNAHPEDYIKEAQSKGFWNWFFCKLTPGKRITFTALIFSAAYMSGKLIGMVVF